MDMDFKPGMVIVTQGDPKSWVSRAIRFATGSWWTHGFVVLTPTEGLEAKIPRVATLNIQERIAELEAGDRDYIVMDLPGITDAERQQVVTAAMSFNHRMYDIWNCVYYTVFKVWAEGGRRLICSRLMSASFFDGLALNVFEHVHDKLPDALQYRESNLIDGYCSPDEFFRYSDLEVVYRRKG
jgi:hypothetical protein